MIDKEHIRLCKSSYNVDGRYWYHPEILCNRGVFWFNEWLEPYAVNYKTLGTAYKIESINPRNETKLHDFLQECLDWVNYYENQEDWKIVDKDEYNRIYDLRQRQKCNKNKYVYL